MATNRSWDVLLIGGASGVGKSRLAGELASIYGVDVFHVDDLQVALETLTTPAQQPELHFWRTNWDEFSRSSDTQLVEHFVTVAREVFEPALVAIIAQHLDEGWPVVVEGDFITPQLATMAAFEDQLNGGRVQGLFLSEDEAQIAANYHEREGDGQGFRAHASWLNSEWVRARCEELGVATLPARPWASLGQRAVEALERDTRDGAAPAG